MKKLIITESQYKLLNEQLYKQIGKLFKTTPKVITKTSKVIPSKFKNFNPSTLGDLAKGLNNGKLLDKYIESVNSGNIVMANKIKDTFKTFILPEEYFDDLINIRKKMVVQNNKITKLVNKNISSNSDIPNNILDKLNDLPNFNISPTNKVVGKDNKPILLYHNTDNSSPELSKGFGGTVEGIFFTPSHSSYEEYGNNKFVTIIDLKKPYYTSEAIHNQPQKMKLIKSKGYDGIINHRGYSYEKPKNLTPNEYIEKQNIFNNVEGKDNRNELDLSKSHEIISFKGGDFKVLGKIDNKTKEFIPFN